MKGFTGAVSVMGVGVNQVRISQGGIRLEAAGGDIKDCKQRGEWAELCFMARAAGEGLKVSRPWGDTASYDVGVEYGGRFMRVQVKSTIYRRRNGEFSLNVCGPKRKKYKKGTVDFFAVYLIPIDTWYIIPYEVVGKTNFSLHFTVGSKRQKYGRFREAWELMKTGSQVSALRRQVSGVRIEAAGEEASSSHFSQKTREMGHPAREMEQPDDWEAVVRAHPYTKVAEELLATGF